MGHRDKIKIMHIIAGLGGGGRERRMLELVKELDKKEHYEQFVILLINKIDYTDIYNTRAKLITIDFPYKLKTVLILLREIKRIAPDIIHVWTEIHYILIVLSLFKHILNYKLIIGFLADGNPIRTIINRIAYKMSYFAADKIVSNSKAGIIAKEADLNKSVVIYNGFTFDRFKFFNNYNKADIKKELDIPTLFVVTMMARFNSAKDWDMFLEVAAIIQNKNTDITFIAVGQGDSLQFYMDSAKRNKLNNIIFTGFRKDIDKILFCSDICLLFTNEAVHAEGISNSIMEAMAAGKPVIATEGGGTSEIINNGINGYMILPKEAEKAAGIIIQLLKSDRLYQAISNNARETILNKFSLKNMVQEYVDLYTTILN